MADIQSHVGLVNGDTGAPILELLHDNGDGTFSRVIYIKGGTAGGPATIADGADVAQGAKADTAWDGAAASPTIMAVLKRAATLPPAYGAAVAASATFTRPGAGDTNIYASGDLVANSTTAGSVVAMSFTVARVAAGSGMVRRLRLRKSGAVLTNASFRLHLYATAPVTITNGDNGAWSTSGVADYLGSLDVTMDKAFTDGAEGIGTPAVGNEIAFALASGQTIAGLLEARAAYTPISAEVFTATLEVLQN